MRILFIHADHMEYETKEKTKFVEEAPEHLKKVRLEDVLVTFATIEKKDEKEVDRIVTNAASEIREIASKVRAQNVLLYPYAHLSASHASPKAAIEILKKLEGALKTDLSVVRAPFGWYKSFNIACKGHPLSELSREIGLDLEGESGTESVDEGKYFVLTQEGSEIEPEAHVKASDDFRAMLEKEALKRVGEPREAPKYLRLCKKFGLEWEPMSDSGHMRYGPKGALMFDLVADYASMLVNSMGLDVFKVKGTNMFNIDEPAVKEHADLYGDRLYIIDTEKKSFVLRYAACHQQFAMMKDWNISYKQLPFGAFEVADSYRLEQSGEAMLCFRVRRMNLPDFHVVCRDENDAKDWLIKVHDKIMEEVRTLNRDYELLINLSSQKAYEDNRELILRLLKKEEKDGLIHIYPEGKNFYWTLNIEDVIIDDNRRPREIGTVQIDVGNAERFDITYTDEKGEKKYPVILHTALIGTIERYLYMILDTAVSMETDGRPGYVPLWLNPEQVRFLTVKDEHYEKAVEMADVLAGNNVRVGIDERSLTISRKVKEAKQDWVGYVAVIGDKELKSDTLKVYDREKNADVEMTLDDLISQIRLKMTGKPFRTAYFPRDMGKRPS